MKRLKGFNHKFEPCAVTVGKFDALHKGHVSIFNALTEIAQSNGLSSVVISFSPTPYEFFNGTREKSVLTEKERGYILKQLNINIDIWAEIPFDSQTAEMSAEDFVCLLKEGINCKHIIAGTDFRFGKERQGNVKFIQNFGITEISNEKLYNEKISGKDIRKAILEANFGILSNSLGYNYPLIGKVHRGKALGRKLGFPTANVAPPQNKLLPPDGVYLTNAVVDGERRPSVTNVGKSDVANEHERLVEVHILTDTGDIYDKEIIVEFIDRIRGPIKFETLGDLRTRVNEDIEAARAYFMEK